ncbi:efflux RND transporter periplasmic adaptor subunit [Panacibacter ginsenosidivorans]|nr:efflux RND transporter periplasmic adaptor subunit [Panacibacter ginsenosidivorans]
MNFKDNYMQKIVNIVLFGSALFLASCGAKSDATNNGGLAAKKAQLEELKKQQQKIGDDITRLEADIAKLDPSSAKTEKTKLVAIDSVETGTFTHYIDLQGTVTSDNISYVSPRGQGGLVKQIFVKQGDHVSKGQQLLKLDDAVYLKNLQQAQTQLSYAQDLYRRQKNLWDQQIGTELQLIQAKQNVDQLNDQIATIKEQWSMTNIYADVSGIAEQVNVRVGEFFTGYVGQTPQIAIVNNEHLKVRVQVPENYADRVNTGTNMIVSLPDANKTYNTAASVSGKIIDPNSRSFYVDAKLPSDKDLRPNQVALVKLQDYVATNAITIPVNTLQTDEKGKFVLVAVNENGKWIAKKKPIEIGQLYGSFIEIKSGLEKGDKIITDGYQGLFDGQPITIEAK